MLGKSLFNEFKNVFIVQKSKKEKKKKAYPLTKSVANTLI